MSRIKLTDKQWETIRDYLRGHLRVYVGDERGCRQFVEAVLWMLRSGAQWRLLPATYGGWNSIFKRFSRWSEHGVWTGLLAHVAADADLQHVLMDSTVVRAHACAAGGKKQRARTRAGVLPGRVLDESPRFKGTPWEVRCDSYSRADRNPIVAKRRICLRNSTPERCWQTKGTTPTHC